MAHDRGMGWQSVQDLPAHQREFLLDEIDLLDDVVQTPWVEKEEERRNRAYDRLYTKFKKAADESGQPISADNAEWLVRCHPSMPSPFFGRASRATFTLVKHPPDEIQQHFDGAFGELVQKTFTVLSGSRKSRRGRPPPHGASTLCMTRRCSPALPIVSSSARSPPKSAYADGSTPSIQSASPARPAQRVPIGSRISPETSFSATS